MKTKAFLMVEALGVGITFAAILFAVKAPEAREVCFQAVAIALFVMFFGFVASGVASDKGDNNG